MSCLIQILNGFGELVMNGVIHRDLKPDNILLCGGMLKIGDFGFAKNLNSTSSLLKTLVGTPAYMAPQILKEERYNYKCDIWSLGVIVYEMVVGKIPWQFTQNNLECFRKEILTRQVTIPETVAISANMRNFIYGCICLDEAKRLDWGQIFTHALFGKDLGGGYFKKEGSTKINFIMSNFRMNIHTKNLSLNKLLAGVPNPLSKNTFKQFVLLVEPYSTEEDITIFFKYIEKNGFVAVEGLKEFLVKHDCSLTGMELSGIEEEDTSSSSEKRNLSIIQRLKNAIEKENLIIWSIFCDIKDKDVNYEVFKRIVWRVDASMSESDCEFFFKAFDIKASKLADVASLYRFLCKIAQEVPKNE
jgi:serine/threonine protein kinase